MCRPRRKPSLNGDTDDLDTWDPHVVLAGLHLTEAERAAATPEQVAFADQVQELIERIGVRGLDLAQTEAALWEGELFHGALLILLPLRHSLHVGIQLQMTPTAILAAWEDKHYVWDSTPEGREDLRIEAVDAGARSLALAWLERELRRPATRREYRLGPFRAVTWQHDDDPKSLDSEGFLPIQPPGTRCMATPAGYLDG